MRDKSFFSFVLLSLALLPTAVRTQTLHDNPEPVRARSADWDRVQDLARGDGITVARAGTYSVPCRFVGATDNELFCDSMFSGREYRFSRAEVERVRMEDKRKNMRILIGSFAAAGLVWGVATPPPTGSTAPRVVDGLAGAALGGFVGLIVSVPAAVLIPGRLIYRHSPSYAKTGHPAPPSKEGPSQSSGDESAP
jgi:hypothetical protein